MSSVLNNVTTSDAYSDQNTLRAPGSERLMIHVRNAAIAYQLGAGIEGIAWRDEVFLPPGTLSIDRTFDAVRVRSWVAGWPAQVTIDAGPQEA